MLKTFDTQISAAVLVPVAEYFKMLSEVSRLQILSCLRAGPMNGKEIIEATGIGQANLSKHLKALTQAGILSRQPQGVTVYYEIADPIIFDLCELVCDRITNQIQQRAEEFEQFKDFIKTSNR
jgi:DNA-binding transcriptional ArsR family regulator